jgi:serine protease AprX
LPVKVAAWNGATDVSTVLAGLEWIAAHRERYGIRVVNLSYGTDSSQPALEDPLNHAVQRLWRAGVLVVVGAGNRGALGIDKPGDDPWVVTVGAADTHGTEEPEDDEVAPFSGRAATGKPDLLAPGVSLVSHRAADGTIDELRRAARVDEHYFKGTGTSQAAAVVSGVAARMFDANPALTANEAKAALVASAESWLAGRPGAGAGLVDAEDAVEAAEERAFATRPANRRLAQSTGRGSLDSSRGGFKPYTDYRERGKPEPLVGEVGALGAPWDAIAWAGRAWTSAAWPSSEWAPYTALAEGWGPAVPAAAWSGLGWDENSWTAKKWGDAGIPEDDWIAKKWGSALWNGMG